MNIDLAQRLAALLHRTGIQRVFGLPGGENLTLLEALRKQGLHFELAHHEASAIYMADAAARLQRRPTVCLVTLGPGAANALAGVAHAFLDRSPILLITALDTIPSIEGHSHQRLDLRSLFEPITKASLRITPGNADALVPAAFITAQSGRPGPVHLGLTAGDASVAIKTDLPPISQPRPFLPDEALIMRIAEILSASRRPVFVAGLGLEPEAPYEALRQLAEQSGAPVITTPKAKGALPDDHPLAAGTFGLTYDDPAYRLLDESDCVIAIGFDVVELVKPWQQAAPLVWLANWPNQAPRLPAVAEWVGPLRPILYTLSKRTYARESFWGTAAISRYITNRAPSRPYQASPSNTGVSPMSALETIRQNVPAGAVVVTDVGAHKIMAALHWRCYQPNSYLVSNGLSVMGYGLPAAIAAGICLPEQVILALIGDGGLAMAMGELRLLAELTSTVIVIVFRDDSLELIRSKQRRLGQPAFATTFVGPDLNKIAAGYDLAYYRVATADQCATAMQSAVEAGRPAIVELIVDVAGYPTAAQE